jgi:hypothetical protein
MLLLLGLSTLHVCLRVLRKFILSILQPRVFMTSETRHSCVEMMMVIPCDRLRTGRNHDRWDGWLQTFLDQFCMSAGCIVFTHFMSEQMLSCMERIHHGKALKWNLSRHRNRDFERLWVYFNCELSSKSMAHNVTNMEFTPNNFVRLFEDS